MSRTQLGSVLQGPYRPRQRRRPAWFFRPIVTSLLLSAVGLTAAALAAHLL